MTDAELHDLLQRLFGLGTWDEDGCSDTPWWRARQIEIAKIKRSRTSRGVTAEHLALAAEYCKAHGLPVLAVTWLYRHITPAIRWRNERSRAAAVADVDELVAQAIEFEQATPNSPWLDRLVRARGPYRQEVLSAWQQQQQVSPRSSRSGQQAERPTA